VSTPPHIFILAGESSGDRLGAALMRRLREESPGVQITGVGGEAMMSEGLISVFPMQDIAGVDPLCCADRMGVEAVACAQACGLS